jgi:hypothetical protein
MWVLRLFTVKPIGVRKRGVAREISPPKHTKVLGRYIFRAGRVFSFSLSEELAAVIVFACFVLGQP